MDSNSAPEGGENRFNRWLVFGALLTPGILSIIVLFNDSSNYGEAALFTLMVTSAIAGIICGTHIALIQQSKSTRTKIAVGIGATIGYTMAAFGLGIGGCFLVSMAAGL